MTNDVLRRCRLLPLLLSLGLVAPGCLLNKFDPKTKPVTAVEPKWAISEYWFKLPAVEHIDGTDYDTLWNACELAIQDGSFTLERFDYRSGLLTTKPLISKQFFELWKHDIVDFNDQVLSDAATRRRVAHFEISKRDKGGYVCDVKVVIEHYSTPERRITAVVEYRDAFSNQRQLEQMRMDDGSPVRVDYWYAERRDEPLEHWLAGRVRARLAQLTAQASGQ